MRDLPKKMIGLLVGAAMLAPVAAQAQEQGRERGGWSRGGESRGGGMRGGGESRGSGEVRSGGESRSWRGGDRGASVNGDARREALRQARESARAVERPAPVAPIQRADNPGDSSRREWNRGETDRRVERQRDAASVNNDGDRRRWDRGDNDGRRDGNRGDRTDRRVDRDGDGNRDRNWNRDRDRDGRNDRNQRWSSDRRDWNGRDWDQRNDRWSRDWRNDRRYGWQDYRKRNRNIYRQPRYEARHGYSYRRWYPGYRFDSWFYSSSFWINDPWQYRLPPAYGPYRWVRYYDDVVLVDTRSGEIVDIIYDFFF